MRSRLGVWLEWRLFSEKGGWRRWGLQWRCSVLSQIFHNNLALGGAQAVVALVFALSVMFLARRWAIHMEREVVVSLIRGLVQIIATVSYTHLRAHETDSYLVCRLLLEKKKKKNNT